MPYLIDGNNLLGSWGGPRGGDDRRAEVVRRVAAFCRAKGAKATIVFDGEPLRADVPEQDLGPLSVRVPGPGRDADTLIREIVERAAQPGDITVVTSDKPLGEAVRRRGALVLRAHEWNALERSVKRAADNASEKPEREDDVEGWLKRFGGE